MRTLSRWKYATRKFARRRHSFAFSSATTNAIGRIEVINLDRALDRWARLHSELAQHTDFSGEKLTAITQRFRATDARDIDTLSVSRSVLIPQYTLAQQFSVDPNYSNLVMEEDLETLVTMTKQEVAIAISHIEVWKKVAASDVPFTLIIEDDVYFTRGSSRGISKTWSQVDTNNLDLLYLSFSETGERRRKPRNGSARKPEAGLWHASGYVLSAAGARKLLAALPMVGPVDLWLNMQFDVLKVMMADRSYIEQRPGVPSSNQYSIMPALSKTGAIRREAPQLVHRPRFRQPIIVTGSDRAGLASVAAALSVLGYRTAAHLDALPSSEFDALCRGSARRIFDAYVDIGIDPSDLRRIVARGAQIISVGDCPEQSSLMPPPDLVLRIEDQPWKYLCGFLNAPYPDEPWPVRAERSRLPAMTSRTKRHRNWTERWDSGPWVLRREPIAPVDAQPVASAPSPKWLSATESTSLPEQWYERSDTFPSNRALFRPEQVTKKSDGRVVLVLEKNQSAARPLAGAAIATCAQYQFGRFGAVLRAAPGSGVVTGLFLHRNLPRQEIDIEILGHRPTEMLVNVFFNPGDTGTRLETGYFGTPQRIPLGFDATLNFHRYEIEWTADYIRWRVDGLVVHERSQWTPTPIPDQAMEFNLNLWSSESVRFAGPFHEGALPTRLEVASLAVPSQSNLRHEAADSRARGAGE